MKGITLVTGAAALLGMLIGIGAGAVVAQQPPQQQGPPPFFVGNALGLP